MFFSRLLKRFGMLLEPLYKILTSVQRFMSEPLIPFFINFIIRKTANSYKNRNTDNGPDYIYHVMCF